jgi:hypothetical protein
MFNYINFFEQNLIPYITEGVNVARGHVNIRCPFCAEADPSEHMGINLATGEWGCWRNASHRGVSAKRLVMVTLPCSFDEALSIVGDRYQVDISKFDEFCNNIFNKKVEKVESRSRIASLTLDKSFKVITDSGLGERFFNYLHSRKFNRDDINEVIRKYDLRYSMVGDFGYRIIFPIYFEGELVTWTGRVISQSMIRYKSLSVEKSIHRITDILFNDSSIFCGGDVLVITEGPFDAIKVDFYGERYGVKATCLFGMNVSSSQRQILSELAERFDKFVLLLDSKEIVNTLSIKRSLPFLNLKIGRLPNDIEDPGDLTDMGVKEFVRNI